MTDSLRSECLRAVIFDFDGVLADTEPIHLQMFQRVLTEEGFTLTPADYYSRYVGLTDTACLEAVARDQGSRLSILHLHNLVKRKARYTLEALSTVDRIATATKQVVITTAQHYPTAIASGALREEIELCLANAGLLDLFECIVAAQDVSKGKPSPEPYLRVVDRLSLRRPLRACDCLAFEDTPTGIRAAQQAGLRCVGVATTLPAARLHAADRVVDSLAHVRWPDLIDQLWPTAVVTKDSPQLQGSVTSAR